MTGIVRPGGTEVVSSEPTSGVAHPTLEERRRETLEALEQARERWRLILETANGGTTWYEDLDPGACFAVRLPAADR